MKTAVIFLAPGFEEIEALTPADYLRRAGVKVTTVAVPQDGIIEQLVPGTHGITVQADITIKEYLKQTGTNVPDAVIVPGGMPGAANIGACSDAVELIKKVYAAKKLTAAICAAPAVVLVKTGVLAGREWTCYPGMEEQVSKYCSEADTMLKGSIHKSGVPFVTDGNVVTSRGPGTAEQFAMELVRILCGQAAAEKIHAGCVQR